ncbi:transporter substrate-binding domain-containing protein [Desulfobacter postgatei]|uniref:transporter substrate-binding domain-containing protein n=1 Tax=Desulfobacter postgatei TaxID=2293 RepID=UPI002A36F7E1|nr:transporter substrate-binding domain-containing protein [Desulfobacter postgatei]MDX9963907.1 transporter substrate-binding domain-containing protein [Desulfobacter postgatei]
MLSNRYFFGLKYILIILFASIFTASTGMAGTPPREVVVAVGTDSIPYYFLDQENHPAGLVVDIWNIWAQRTGINVVFTPLPFYQTLIAVQNGDADVHGGCFFNQTRSKTLDFIAPVVKVRTHFFVKKNILGVNRLEDLRGFRIGIIKGDAAIDYLKQKLPDATLAVYPDNQTLFDAVKSDDILAFVKDTNIALAMLKQKGIMNQYRYFDQEPLYEADWFCAVRRGNNLLAEIVRKGMQEIPQADKAAVFRKWTGRSQDLDSNALTIACGNEYPPMSMISATGHPSGMLLDVWRLWATKTGRKINFKFFSQGDSLKAIEDGRADIHSGLSKSKEREKTIAFSQPFYRMESGFFYRLGPDAPTTLADLQGKIVGTDAGTIPLNHLQANDSVFLVQTTDQDLLQEASQGTFDLFFAELPYVSVQLEQRGEQGNYGLLPQGKMTKPIYAGVAKNNPTLLETVNKGIAAMSDLELADIEARWIKDPSLRQFGNNAMANLLTPEEKAWLKAHQVIPLLGDAGWPPISFADPTGRYKGVAADYINLIGRRLGIRFEVISDYTWNQMTEMIKAGKANGITCIVKAKEREPWLSFTTPYFVSPYVIVTKKETPVISGIENLAGKTLAIEEGYFLQSRLETRYPKVILKPVKNTVTALENVANGTTDAYAGNLMVIKYLLNKKGIDTLKIAAPAPWPESRLCLGIRKEWPLLVSSINKAIENISQESHPLINLHWMEDLEDTDQETMLLLSHDEKEWLKAHPTVRLGIDPVWPPFEFYSMEHGYSGLASEYIKKIAKRLNISMQPQTDMTWQQAMDKGRQKEIDLFACITPSPKRSQFLNFTKPYLSFPMVIAAGTDFPFISGLEELKGKTIAVAEGYISHEILQKDFPKFKLSPVDSVAEGLKRISQNRADVFVGNLASITYSAKQTGLANIKISAVTPYKFELSMGVRKDWPQLVSILDKVLTNMPESEKNRIRDDWVRMQFEHKTNWALLWKWILGMTLVSGTILGIILFSNKKLRKAEASLMESHKKLALAVAEARKEKQKALAADKAKSEFLANMSHEIRTPMNAIIGMTHLIMQTRLDARQMDYAAKIDASAKSLLNLINDILDFSKIEAGKMDMEIVPFSLDEAMEKLAGLITVKAAAKKDLEVLFRVDPEIPNFLKGDSLRLNQVLVNLGNNAVKFTEKGHIIVSVDMLKRYKEQVVLKFSVTDSGIGMTPEQQKKLFKVFSQADSSTTRKYGGTGLGLAISKRIIEMMGGEIFLESLAGKGSTFSFTVPMALGPNAARKQPEPDDTMTGIRILVIDDNPASRQIFIQMLNNFSITARDASSGKEGLSMITAAAEQPYDLVLVDLQMPDMDGFETVREIQRIMPANRQPKIILACTMDDEQVRSQAGDMGIESIIVKPTTASQLFESLLSAFGRQKLIPIQKSEEQKLSRTILGANILLAEDHDINQQVAKEILESAGFFVQIANNGEQALSMSLSQDFDLVLMDLQMPVMDGYEATREIRRYKTAGALPIVAMTASAMPRDRAKAMAAGMNSHVSKPIDLKELFQTLSRWIKPGDRPVPNGFGEKPDKEISLNDVPGISVQQALSRMDKNEALYLGLLEKFRQNYAHAHRDLRDLIEKGQDEDAQRLAHSIKGVAGNIGMTELQAAAANLETAFRDRMKSEYDTLMTLFSQALPLVLSSVDQLTGSVAKGALVKENLEIKSEKELIVMLNDLAPFVKKQEAKPAKDRIKKMNALAWPKHIESDIAELVRLISRYQFKPAAEIIEKLIVTLEDIG